MFKQNIPAGEARPFSQPGRYVRVDSGSRLRVTTDQGESAESLKGETWEFAKGFASLQIENLSAADELVQIRVSTGRMVGAEQVEVVGGNVTVDSMPAQTVNVGVVAPTPVNESPDTPDINVPAGQTVQLHDPVAYPCDTVEFYAGEANLYNLRVWPGGDGVTVQGGYLAPGGSGDYPGELPLWAHNPSATDQTIAVTKLKRV